MIKLAILCRLPLVTWSLLCSVVKNLCPPGLSQPVRAAAVPRDMFCWLLESCSVVVSVHYTSLSQWGFRQSCRTCSVDCSAMLLSQSTEPLSASEGFGSPAGRSVDCSAMLLSQSTEPLSASEGFGSPAGCVVMTAPQCWYLWGFQQSYLTQPMRVLAVLPQPMRVSAVLPQPMRVLAVLQDVRGDLKILSPPHKCWRWRY